MSLPGAEAARSLGLSFAIYTVRLGRETTLTLFCSSSSLGTQPVICRELLLPSKTSCTYTDPPHPVRPKLHLRGRRDPFSGAIFPPMTVRDLRTQPSLPSPFSEEATKSMQDGPCHSASGNAHVSCNVFLPC